MTTPVLQAPAIDAGLPAWLAWLESIHPTEIELGLSRVAAVAAETGLAEPGRPLITVAGTNGKGSTVALLAKAYHNGGYRVGAYSSPHITRFNERITLNTQPVDDATIVQALARIETLRGAISLTYFEYTTLAAMQVFVSSGCDVVILEVGLGGRLDATNIWNTDCAIVTSIGLDHEDWLGNDRATIAREKMAIGRADIPLIVGEPDLPDGMSEAAIKAGMQWQWVADPALGMASVGQHQERNAACARAALDFLHDVLPVSVTAWNHARATVHMPARFERRDIDGVLVVMDVAHNPAAAEALMAALSTHYPGYSVHAIFAALADKDIASMVRVLAGGVSSWHCVSLAGPRGLLAEALQDVVQSGLGNTNDASVNTYTSMQAAWDAARACAQGRVLGRVLAGGPPGPVEPAGATNPCVAPDQRSLVLVAGSFHTIGAFLEVVA